MLLLLQPVELNVPLISIPLAVPVIVAGQLSPNCGDTAKVTEPPETEPLTVPKKPP